MEYFIIEGKKSPKREIYNICYNNNNKLYKWIIFIDIDEYIFLKSYLDIHEYLSQQKFIKCDSICLNWVIHTDNELFYYDNRTLKERFPRINKNKNFCVGKSIIKGNIKNIHLKSVHTLNNSLKICDGLEI